MAKANLKNAFCLCPVHRDDWPLLGFQWRSAYFVDKCLPFVLRSAPFFFNQLADAIQWILSYHHGVEHSFHYLDDFFFSGPPVSSSCSQAVSDMVRLCHNLGVPLKQDKLVGPATSLTFLGMHLDSVAQQASLPPEKLDLLLEALCTHVHLYESNSPVFKKQLPSLNSRLSFAMKVVPAGRIFLRRLLNFAHSTPLLDAPLHISTETILDIHWWLCFARKWNGMAFFLDSSWSYADNMHLFTNASSRLGFGAYWADRWFNAHWSPT